MTFYDKDIEDYRVTAKRSAMEELRRRKRNKWIMFGLFVVFFIILVIFIG